MKFEELITKLAATKKPLLAVLIDPDKFDPELVRIANKTPVSCFLVGGSILKKGDIAKTVRTIKKISDIPVVLFPGDEKQLTKQADGLFLPSLLSGNNPDYLIGKQVLMAPVIRRFNLPHVPMAYLLLNGKAVSSTQKITRTRPMDHTNTRLIVDTALAAQQLGFKLLYLEAGSGAKNGVPLSIIKAVRKTIRIPLIVGGGINTKQKALALMNSGANMLVIGNAFEKNVSLLTDIGSVF